MKSLLAACLLALIPALASAQAPIIPSDAPPKPKPFEPVLAAAHSGPGRIGVRLDFDKITGKPVIVALTRGGPGADFGLRVGDVIVKIDKNYTDSLTQDEIRLALHGEPGTGVELTIQRDDDPRFIIRAVERRVLTDDMEEMTKPPMSGVAKPDEIYTSHPINDLQRDPH